MMESTTTEPSTTLFFAYGSHMFTVRNELDNIRAEFVSIARLDNYRLDFIRYSKFWGGPQATVVPTANAQVWGVIWRVNKDDIEIVDENKQVHLKRYYVTYTEVNTPHMGKFVCRVYIQKISPLPRGDNDDIPVERWPSRSYKKVMILGAIEHNLPYYYIRNLKKLKHNGEFGCYRMAKLLKLFTTREPCTCTPYDPRRPRILNMKKLREKKNVK
ncbi:PREDICTED: gamma-glutamylcyclotransferase-like [Papilio xuthus]|uniref:gamma-glutamylcyclotransferase n=1 Tax=Papilio xuthus TaxID=66420 RepID=A0AAJ6ZNQ9_PAPXU|nr:PREDICTED: gamma-glutamylcyclotransferase-like [Papilio xuthus]